MKSKTDALKDLPTNDAVNDKLESLRTVLTSHNVRIAGCQEDSAGGEPGR